MQDSDQIPVTSNLITDAASAENTKKQARHLRHSNWLITINTNKTFDADNEDSQELYKKFVKVIGELTHPQDLSQLITVKKEGHTLSPQFIKSVNIEGAIEKQGRRGQLHAHIYFKIEHYTQLGLRYDVIKQAVKDAVGTEIYFNAKFYSQPKDFLENNLRKYIIKEQQFELKPIEKFV